MSETVSSRCFETPLTPPDRPDSRDWGACVPGSRGFPNRDARRTEMPWRCRPAIGGRHPPADRSALDGAQCRAAIIARMARNAAAGACRRARSAFCVPRNPQGIPIWGNDSCASSRFAWIWATGVAQHFKSATAFGKSNPSRQVADCIATSPSPRDETVPED